MADIVKSDENSGYYWLLNTAWDYVTGESSLIEKSARQLYEEYRATGRTPRECAINFIEWQTAKAAGAGFILGIPGGLAVLAAIPAEVMATAYLQLRAAAVIGLLFGWELHSDRLKTVAFLSLLGSAAGDVLQKFGIDVGQKIGAVLIAKIPGSLFIEINKAVGFRLITKAGQRGIINMPMAIPFIGALFGAGINGFVTYNVSYQALEFLERGPLEDAGKTLAAPEPCEAEVSKDAE